MTKPIDGAARAFWNVVLALAFGGGTLFFLVLGVEAIVFQWVATPVDGVVVDLSDRRTSGDRRDYDARVELALPDGPRVERLHPSEAEYRFLQQLPRGQRRQFWVAPSITGRQIHLEQAGQLARPWGFILPLVSMVPALFVWWIILSTIRRGRDDAPSA